MATIRKHPVPTDSYDPKRPLNDLLLAQLEHFKHIARSLSSELRDAAPAEPSTEDREGVDRFIQAITAVHVSRKKAKPQLAAKLVRPKQPRTLSLAAAAGANEKPTKNNPARSNSQGKSRSKAKPSNARSSKR